MAFLKIRYENKKCRIECTSVQYPAFLMELEEKLNNSFFYKNGYSEIYFSFPYEISEAQCMKLFDLCDKYHVYVMEIEAYRKQKAVVYLKDCFHNGEEYRLYKECIYIGDIHKNVRIISNHDLYIVGTVRGVIDLLHKNCTISAAAFKECRIRIYDSTFQNLTNCAPCKVYYENEEIKVV